MRWWPARGRSPGGLESRRGGGQSAQPLQFGHYESAVRPRASGHGHARTERLSEEKRLGWAERLAPSGSPGVGGADAHRPAEGFVCSNPAEPQRSRSRLPGNEAEHSRGRWFACGTAVPLALVPQWTRAAVANTGPIDDAQAPIGALFGVHAEPGRCLQDSAGSHPAGGKGSSRKAVRFPGARSDRWSVPPR